MGHVEVLVTPEQVVDLMTDHTRGRYEHLIQTDASDHGESMRARVVGNGAEDFGQAEERPESVTGVTADQREETIAPRRQRLSKERLHDAFAGERWPAPGADAHHVDPEAVDGPFVTPRGVDDGFRRRVGNTVIDEETQRESVRRAEVDPLPDVNVVGTYAGASCERGGHDAQGEEIPGTSHGGPPGRPLSNGTVRERRPERRAYLVQRTGRLENDQNGAGSW